MPALHLHVHVVLKREGYLMNGIESKHHDTLPENFIINARDKQFQWAINLGPKVKIATLAQRCNAMHFGIQMWCSPANSLSHSYDQYVGSWLANPNTTWIPTTSCNGCFMTIFHQYITGYDATWLNSTPTDFSTSFKTYLSFHFCSPMLHPTLQRNRQNVLQIYMPEVSA